jgi:hypothetical protein
MNYKCCHLPNRVTNCRSSKSLGFLYLNLCQQQCQTKRPDYAIVAARITIEQSPQRDQEEFLSGQQGFVQLRSDLVICSRSRPHMSNTQSILRMVVV